MGRFLATFAQLKAQTYSRLSTSVEEEKSKDDWFLEISTREQALLRATSTLIDEGEPVLLSLGRSILPVLGRPDPWVDVAASLGVRPDTARVILERVAVDESNYEAQQWQKLPAPVRDAQHPLVGAEA